MQVTWTTNAEGDIKLGLMTDAHIRNCIGDLQLGKIVRTSCNGFMNREWILIFGIELRRRARLAS